jgi:hypothetical protein
MPFILLMQCLTLHTLQNKLLNIGLMNSSGEEQGIQRSKIPDTKSLPHEMHSSWAQRDEVGESVVEEEDLVILVVVGAIKP